MNSGNYVFAQIMELVSSISFQTIVRRHLIDQEGNTVDFPCKTSVTLILK